MCVYTTCKLMFTIFCQHHSRLDVKPQGIKGFISQFKGTKLFIGGKWEKATNCKAFARGMDQILPVAVKCMTCYFELLKKLTPLVQPPGALQRPLLSGETYLAGLLHNTSLITCV